MKLDFVTGEPALMIGNTMVIADLHLGAEYDYRTAGIKMPSQTPKVEERLMRLLNETKVKRLLILGDVKHRVPGSSFQEEREVPSFLSRLSRKVDVEVLPGNHDGGLAKLSPNIKIHPSEGILLDGFYLSHGHAWPGKNALNADAIIIGHNHPQVEFSDRLGKIWRERIWLRTSITAKKLKVHYKNIPKHTPDLILMPSFSELVGGWCVNRKDDEGRLVGGLGPITKCADIKHALAYMIDGTFLGEVSRI